MPAYCVKKQTMEAIDKMTKLVQEYFINSAQRFPDKIAINFKEKNLTYKQLDIESNQLANLLIKLNANRNDRIAFCLHKSHSSIISILGILKAGGCYVPLDANSPLSRLKYIVEDCQPAVIICDQETLEKTRLMLDELKQNNCFCPQLITISPLDKSTNNVIYSREDILKEKHSCPKSINIDSDLAYILYTSGSTGKPKGVMINHHNIISFVEWAVNRFGITEQDKLSNHAPMHFDLSTFDIYCTFKTGASLYLVPQEINLFPEKLISFIEDKELTIWLSVPSILVYLARMNVLTEKRMPKLRTIFSTGEVFPTPYLVQWMKLFPRKTFINMFGPTETTVECTYYIIKEIPTNTSKDIPIGNACEHLEIFALNEERKLINVGELGELYVKGPSVSTGYWNNLEKTEQAFIKNPFSPRSQEKVYKTGDLVVLNEDGTYTFRGRKDNQIKFMGYRIELGEIESALYSLEYIKEAAVIFLPEDGGKIVGFTSLNHDAKVEMIKADLSKVIPKYMLPRTITIMKKLPRTSTGKIDKVNLKAQIEI